MLIVVAFRAPTVTVSDLIYESLENNSGNSKSEMDRYISLVKGEGLDLLPEIDCSFINFLI